MFKEKMALSNLTTYDEMHKRNLINLFQKSVEENAHKVAIEFNDETITYRDLNSRAKRFKFTC